MFFDITPINPTQNIDTSTVVIISISIFVVLAVAVLCTILLKKKNAK